MKGVRKIAFLVCDNGLGHTRRALLVASRILGDGSIAGNQVEITFFANPARISKFDVPSGIYLIPFETRTSAAGLRENDPETWKWHRRLPDLSGFDLVVSDNLSEILETRPDAVLMGSFLWWEALEGLPEDRVEYAKALVKKTKPVLIGTGAFASAELRNLTRFEDVGLFGNPNVHFSRDTPRENALIATGRGGESEEEARGFLIQLAGSPAPSFETVFVEPSLLPDSAPAWMQAARFTPEEYETLSVAVIRPGVGTITDSLSGGARVFSFREKGNRELERNGKGLEEIGVGQDFETIEEAWGGAVRFEGDTRSKALHLERIQGLPLQGAEKAAEILMGIMR